VRNSIAGVLVLTSLAVLFACTAPTEDPPGEGDVDAAPAETPDAGGGGTCEPATANMPNGNHNAGQACLSCHTGAGAPRWQVAGTLFSTAAGGAAIGGATVTITDANNVVTKLITAPNGNFYSGANFAFPVRVNASRCPDKKTMGEAAPNGNCNSCHQAGGVGRIHLP
jgi:hypothetical protein